MMDMVKYFQRQGISDFEIVFPIMNVKLIGHIVAAQNDDNGDGPADPGSPIDEARVA